MSAEHAPLGRRGYYGMFTQLGLGSALVLANLVFLVVYGGFGADNPALLSWGWRVPFLLSAVLIVTALVVRTRVSESPAFVSAVTGEAAAGGAREAPIAALMREQRRQFILVSVAVVGMLALVYETGTFFTHFASTHMGFSASLVLLVGVLGGLCTVCAVAAAAILSDAHGRRRVITIGYCLAVPWSFAVLPLIATGNAMVFAGAIMVTYTVIGIAMGPMAAFVPEMFATRYRYTGAGLSYNIGGIIGGGIPPVISEYLLGVRQRVDRGDAGFAVRAQPACGTDAERRGRPEPGVRSQPGLAAQTARAEQRLEITHQGRGRGHPQRLVEFQGGDPVAADQPQMHL